MTSCGPLAFTPVAERLRLDTLGAPVVKCSNFVGEALDAAAAEGFAEVLFVGHIGKLVKLAGGVMNTHSRYADCRAELMTAHAAICGADTALCRALMDAATTDACIALLDAAGKRGAVMESLLAAMQKHLNRRAAGNTKNRDHGAMRVGAAVFSNEYGGLGETETAKELLETWMRAAARR